VPILGALADSGELIYQLVVKGRVSMSEVRRVMGEAALTQHTQEPPMKYVLCRGDSLADVKHPTCKQGRLVTAKEKSGATIGFLTEARAAMLHAAT
jgi:hypothetical protein